MATDATPQIPTTRRRSALFSLLLILGGLYLLYQAIQTPLLACSRAAGDANCRLSRTLLGWLSVQQTEINRLQSARVGETCDRSGCRYRVELAHAGGTTPFSEAYAAERAPQDAIVHQIEHFLQDPAAAPLAVQQTSGMMEIILPLVIIAAGVVLLRMPPRAPAGGKSSSTQI